MSRIGKLPIIIPENVDINYDKLKITIKGKFGTLQTTIPDIIFIDQEKNILKVMVKKQTRHVRSFHGLYRTLINNMIIGVSKQFEVTLILKGVGYRAATKGNKITLSLGYSHTIQIDIPSEISVEVSQNTIINLKSCNKEALGLFASNIRAWRKPEPYKGKGILYKGEQIIRKAGKSAK